MLKSKKVDHSDWWARALAVLGLCVSVYSIWSGNRTQHLLEAAYFDRQVTIKTVPAVGVRPEVMIMFQNTGRSRANVHFAKSSMLTAKSEQDAFNRLGELQSAKDPTRAEINPGGKLSAPVVLGHEISPDEYANLVHGELRIYIVGELDYEDAFGKSHTRTACDRYDFENQAWVGCTSGNETR